MSIPHGSVERTPRGFRVFGRIGALRVQESSRAFDGAHCWIFDDRPLAVAGGSTAVQLSTADAEMVIAALGDFVREAREGRLTEPA